MEEIKDRLKETAAACEKAYDNWVKERKDEQARQALQDSVHELRKVASRLEIEIAMSERDRMAGKPIAIPQHRSSKKSQDAKRSNKSDIPEEEAMPQVKKVVRRGRKPKAGADAAAE